MDVIEPRMIPGIVDGHPADPPFPVGSAPPAKRRKRATAPTLTDEQWLAHLKTNPAYTHVDFPRELGKMDAWLSLPKNKGRTMTREFILKWLNKLDPPTTLKKATPPPAAPQMTRAQQKMIDREKEKL